MKRKCDYERHGREVKKRFIIRRIKKEIRDISLQ